MGEIDEKDLGKRLQAARKAGGMTQQELCHKANLSYSTLAKIERGAIKSPSIFTIQAIAGALNIGLDQLMGVASPAPVARTLHRTKSGASFIFFDVNGCLVRFYQRAFSQIAADSGVPADIIETGFWHFNDAACRGELTGDDFDKALAERIGVDPDVIRWRERYVDAAESIIEMHELLRWAADNYRIGLLTNIMPGSLAGLRQAGKLPDVHYDAIVDSSEVGAIKPEPEIFKIAEERTGTAPADILLIDDTRANLSAAEQHGWHVLWFDYARPEESVAHIRETLEPAA